MQKAIKILVFFIVSCIVCYFLTEYASQYLMQQDTSNRAQQTSPIKESPVTSQKQRTVPAVPVVQNNNQAPIAGYQRIQLPDIGYIDIPSDLMEKAQPQYKQLSDKMRQDMDLPTSNNSIIIMQKGMKQYARVMIECIKEQSGSYKPLYEDYVFTPAELSSLSEEMKNYLIDTISKIPGGKVLEYYPLKTTKINGMTAFVYSFKRQLNNNPPVLVWGYGFENNDRLINLTLSYRLSEKSIWEPCMNNILNSFRITNIVN